MHSYRPFTSFYGFVYIRPMQFFYSYYMHCSSHQRGASWTPLVDFDLGLVFDELKGDGDTKQKR